MVLHVRNIDVFTIRKGITEALQRYMTDNDKVRVSVTSLKSCYDTTQFVAVVAENQIGKILSGRGVIQIGFVNYKIIKRLT